MNGTLIPHTPIAVDFWKIRECPHARIFFLTHLHGDHITGLTSSWSFPIYCSEITGKLLLQRYGIREDLIHTLQTECAEIIYLDYERKEQMTVTAIEANHCPGAVMFLMQGYFGTILHTGDFRYHPDMLKQSVLSDISGKVDILYLDNTYCSPGCVFPTKDEATTQIIEIIEKHPNKDVLIAMRNLGKESLLCKIAVHFQEWISVPDKFYRTLEILEAPNVFDTGSSDHRIRVVPFYKVSNKFVETVNQERETVVILPTALYCGIECRPYENNEKVFVVPYSDHSSYTELINFVSFIRPRKIIPIVKSNARGPFGLSIADRADMTAFNKYTGRFWNKVIEIPNSVHAFMFCKNHKVLAPEEKGQKRKMKQRQPQTKKLKRGVAYDSPISASKQQTRSPISASKQKTRSPISASKQKTKSPISASKQKTRSPILASKGKTKSSVLASKGKAESPIQASKQEIVKSKSNKENSEKVGKDSPHVRQLLFDEVIEKHSKFDSVQVQKDLAEKTEKSPKNMKKLDVIIKRCGKQPRLVSKQQENKNFDHSKGKNEIHTESNRKTSQDQNTGNIMERLCKKNIEKVPLQFVSTNRAADFDNVFGRRTYSRSNKKVLGVNDVTMFMTDEADEDKRIYETAKWVLESSKFLDDIESQIDRISDDSDENDVSIVYKCITEYERERKSNCVSLAYERKVNGKEKGIKGKDKEKLVLTVKPKLSCRKMPENSRKSEQNKLKFGKQNDQRECVTGIKSKKLNVSAGLKQSAITQYVTKTKGEVKSNSKEASRQEQNIYSATKLCSDIVEIEESLSDEVQHVDVNEIVHLNDNESDEEITKKNSVDIKERNDITNDSEQTKNNCIIVTDPELEKEFEEPDTAKVDYILEKNSGKGDVNMKYKRRNHLSGGNTSKTNISNRGKRKSSSSEENASDAEGELFSEQDAFDESLIAQIGTQVRNLNISIDNNCGDKNKSKYIVKSNGKVGKFGGKSQKSPTCKGYSIVSTDDSSSVLDKTSPGGNGAPNCTDNKAKEKNESSEIIGANKSYEEKDLSIFVNVGSQNKAAVTDGNNRTVSKDNTALWTFSNDDADVSTLANIGSQKQDLALENTERKVTETEKSPNHGKTQTGKSYMKRKEAREYEVSNCRKCELDSFEEVFDQIEINEFDKVIEGPPTSRKKRGIHLAKTTQKRYKTRCRPVIRCSFSVKPINVL